MVKKKVEYVETEQTILAKFTFKSLLKLVKKLYHIDDQQVRRIGNSVWSYNLTGDTDFKDKPIGVRMQAACYVLTDAINDGVVREYLSENYTANSDNREWLV